jgi:hypothetical protein
MEPAEDAAKCDVSHDPKEESQSDEAKEIRRDVKGIADGGASLLANAFGFVVPHWIDEHRRTRAA